MVHSLLRRQARDGRKNAEGIRGEEKDILRMATNAGDDSVVDEFNGVGGPGIFRVADVGVIRYAGRRIEHHVLEHRTIADGVEDLRLLFLGEIDALGVASPFEIEYAGRAPAMLVVADKVPQRIGG